ncbi:MAG: PLDc N-terminal domain-containing protein [Bacteroidota bacterium]
MFFEYSYVYYITIILQAICVFHCIKKGNQNKWVWIIVFVPFIGCIIYFFSEIFTKKQMQQVQQGVGSVIASGSTVKKLEDRLRFSDSFNNKIMLADAYMGAGQLDKAIAMYESCLSGAFTENEFVLNQLVIAYSEKGWYEEVLPMAKKIYNLPQFTRSRSHILYAIALEKCGYTDQAEKEFQLMRGRFSFFEARYHYGLLLQNSGRQQEAVQLFTQILEEKEQLSSRERTTSREWFARAKGELKKMQNA